MKDLQSNIDQTVSIAPAAITATATGTGVDLLGYNSAMVSIVSGINTDGTHTPKMQESDDDSTYSDVAAADLVGAFVIVASNSTQKVGYKGVKRYIRAVSTVIGTTTGAVYGAHVVRGNPSLAPV